MHKMNQRSRLLAGAAAVTLALGLTACGGKTDGEDVATIIQMTMPEAIELTVGDAIDPAAETTFWADREGLTKEQVAAAVDALDITWTVEDETVAKMDENGALCAVAEGETKLTAVSADGSLTASMTVTVIPAETEEAEPTATPEPSAEPDSSAAPAASAVPDATKAPAAGASATAAPTAKPTAAPTAKPTEKPAAPQPTAAPVVTPAPTAAPTAVPAPTAAPQPTEAPAWSGPVDPSMDNDTIMDADPEKGFGAEGNGGNAEIGGRP